MSAIVGLVNLDGAPVDPADVEAMCAAIAHWGPDGVKTLTDGCAAFAQLRMRDTPEAVYERLPEFREGRRCIFTAEARLDNRDELCDVLGLSTGERRVTSDTDIVWAACERWSDLAPDHLAGDWSYAVWRPQERRLSLVRDHHGKTSLYYLHEGHRFAFASDKKALLALPGVRRRLNERHFALTLSGLPALGGPETVFDAILRLPPGHALNVQPGALRTWRHWPL